MKNFLPVPFVFVIVITLIPGFLGPNQCLANDFTHPGGYIVVGGLNGFENFDRTEDADIDDAWGYQFRGGYRFNDHFALEGEFDGLDGFDMKFDMPENGRQKLTVDSFIITANLKAYLPLGRFQPYALLGAGVMWADIRTSYPVGTICRPGYWGWWCSNVYARVDGGTSFAMKFGAGADIHLSKNWAITLDASYVNPFTSLEDLKYVSFNWGFRYRY